MIPSKVFFIKTALFSRILNEISIELEYDSIYPLSNDKFKEDFILSLDAIIS